jgi:hypothetical protein
MLTRHARVRIVVAGAMSVLATLATVASAFADTHAGPWPR